MILNIDTFDYNLITTAPLVKRRRGNQGRRNNERQYKDLVCAFDIETTSDHKLKQNFMYIWQVQIEEHTITGRTWDEYLTFLNRISERLKEHEYIVFYVHNLSYEFQYLRGIYDFEPAEVFAMDHRKVLKCEMFAHFEFRCSYLLSNMSLAEYTAKMGVTNTKLSGEEFNYNKMRYPWTPLTEFELNYCINDVKGLVQAVKKQMEIEGDTLHTIALTSTGFTRRDIKAAMRHVNRALMREMQPDFELYQLLKMAMRGGDTHANRYYSGLILDNVDSYDRASSYPDVQINCLFPMGKWIHEPDADIDRVIRKVYIQHRACIIRLAFHNLRLKNPMWGCPYLAKAKCQNVKNGDFDNGRILGCEYCETVITGPYDLDIILDEYEADFIDVLDLYHARIGVLPKPLKDTILKYFNDKTQLKGVSGQELYYNKQKARLNAIYGCSAQDQAKGHIDFIDGEFKERDEDPRELLAFANKRAFQAYAWGCFCTAAARYELHKAIKLVSEQGTFLYCDTDSVKFLGNVDFSKLNNELKQRSKEHNAFAEDKNGVTHYLGVWEHEGQTGRATYRQFVTLGAKKYAYIDDAGKVGITIAGVNKKKGAEELTAHGGLKAFKPGFIFRQSAGVESVYNDTPEVDLIKVGSHELKITSNIYMYESEYTLGITAEYMRLLDRADQWRKINFENL